MYSTADGITNDERAYLHKQLSMFSERFTGPRNYREVAVALRIENGKILGGLTENVIWNWLWIDVLRVEEGIRRKGYGKHLLKHVEYKAKEMGCKNSMVETFEFEALEFYESQEYSIQSRLEEFPDGHTHYRLIKHLGETSGGLGLCWDRRLPPPTNISTKQELQ